MRLPIGSIAFERALNRINQPLANGFWITKADFALGRVNVYVDAAGIEIDEKKGHRMLAFHQCGVVALAQAGAEDGVLDRATIHKDELLIPRLPADTGFADEAADADIAVTFLFHLEKTLNHLGSVKIPKAAEQINRRGHLENDTIIPDKSECDFRVTDRLEMKLMFNVPAFGVFRAKEFSSRRHVIEYGTRLHLGAGRFSAIAHHIELAAVNQNLRPGDRARFACR